MDETLDTPASIAVLGGGPIGIEAALYGRYLGYSVILFEADRLVRSLYAEPNRVPPEVCTSPLGLAAIAAQRGLGTTTLEIQVETCEEWAREYFERIAESDLLAGRLRTFAPVERLELAPHQEDAEAENNAGDADAEVEEGPVPPDFLVHFVDAERGQCAERFEAVIDARGADAAWIGPGDEQAAAVHAYLFKIGRRAQADADFRTGIAGVRRLFATLWGRPGLDVYANLGGEL